MSIKTEIGSLFALTDLAGYMPTRQPLTCLPEQFVGLENLMTALPDLKRDGTHGLLHVGNYDELYMGNGLDIQLPMCSSNT